MPSSWASAIRCRTPLVEPPEAQTQAIAFSSESRVITLLGRDVVGEDVDHQLADLLGDGALVVVFGRDHRRAAGADPQRLEGAGHRVGGELAAAGAGAGAGDALELVQFLVAHVAGVVGADRLEDVEDGDVAAVPVAGGDRAAVEQDRGHVEPGQRHRAAGDRLVAGAEGDDRVELVAAGHQLDRVGDHLAADQRGLHPLGAHRHPVGDGDGVELHRRAAGGADALFDVLGQAAQVEVAGHRLGPGVGDPDRRPAERVVVEADALHVGARVGAVGAVEDGRRAGTGKLGRGGAVGAHGAKSTERGPEREAEDVDRARARRRSRAGRRRPPRRRPRGPAAPPPAASSPRARKAASAEEWVQPEPWAAPSGWRSPAISTDSLAVEEEVDQLLAVAAGDDDRLRARAPARRAPAPPASRALPSPVSARASGMFGVTTVASGSSRSTSAARASSSSRTAPLSATITGSITTGALADAGRAPRPPRRSSPPCRACRS